MHYDFLTVIAIDIYEIAKEKGASNAGILFVISHAALESGWAGAALKAGDYNLFGIMTNGNDFKRKTSHGKVRDYSSTGGFKRSMDDYFTKIGSNLWAGLDLIKLQKITYADIDKAFNTGDFYPTGKERHGGKYAYNADFDTMDNKNHYGKIIVEQMKSVKKRMIGALDYKINVLSEDKRSRGDSSGSIQSEIEKMTAIKTSIEDAEKKNNEQD